MTEAAGEFADGLRPSGKVVNVSRDLDGHEAGQVLHMWVRSVAGEKARAFIDRGEDAKRATVKRLVVCSEARRQATKYGCEAYGILDAETGRLLAFEKAEHVEVQWAARYEEDADAAQETERAKVV